MEVSFSEFGRNEPAFEVNRLPSASASSRGAIAAILRAVIPMSQTLPIGRVARSSG